jgi:putative acetyltransferase
MIIRRIHSSDNLIVGQIIREVLTEFGANREGFAWQDPELDHMSDAYSSKGQVYFVIEEDGKVLGGGGISAFTCNLEACCELQKMYLLPDARGLGWGAQLIDTLLLEANKMSYQFCYLETLNSMSKAVSLYQKKGFALLESPLGESGHNACDEWYLIDVAVFFAKLSILENKIINENK